MGKYKHMLNNLRLDSCANVSLLLENNIVFVYTFRYIVKSEDESVISAYNCDAM